MLGPRSTALWTLVGAIAAVPERLPGVAAFDPAGQAKNAMAVIDAGPSWPDFGEVTGWSELPNADNRAGRAA
jgi:methanethiol oxidase